MVSTRFYLIRHGQIQANIDGHWHGSTDSALTAEGERQAARMAGWLARHHPAIGAIYSSPLQRTRHTAEAAAQALELPVVPRADFREYGIGELEGTPFVELRDRHDFLARIVQDPHFAPAGGESMHGVRERMLAGLDDLRALHAGEEVAVVGHGAAFAIALASCLHGADNPFREYHKRNTGVTCLVAEPDGWRLDYFDRLDHLDTDTSAGDEP